MYSLNIDCDLIEPVLIVGVPPFYACKPCFTLKVGLRLHGSVCMMAMSFLKKIFSFVQFLDQFCGMSFHSITSIPKYIMNKIDSSNYYHAS